MTYYISIDGGGTKLALLLYDETLHPISYAVSAGVNPRFYTANQVKEHCRDCFSKLLKGRGINKISGIYGADLNGIKNTIRIVSDIVAIDEYVELNEGLVGLLANGLYRDGIVALSGTGSTIFYIQNGQLVKTYGGLGALLGDDGSGFTIGREGIRAVINDILGLGEPTLLSSLFSEFNQIYPKHNFDELINTIYQSEYPVAKIASFSRQVGQAAHEGDKTALKILENAGIVMAEQVINVIRYLKVPSDIPICTIGGAYKTHPVMHEAFKRTIQSHGTGHTVHPNLFEPIVGGVLYRRILESNRITPDDLKLGRQYYNDFLYH